MIAVSTSNLRLLPLQLLFTIASSVLEVLHCIQFVAILSLVFLFHLFFFVSKLIIELVWLDARQVQVEVQSHNQQRLWNMCFFVKYAHHICDLIWSDLILSYLTWLVVYCIIWNQSHSIEEGTKARSQLYYMLPHPITRWKMVKSCFTIWSATPPTPPTPVPRFLYKCMVAWVVMCNDTRDLRKAWR